MFFSHYFYPEGNAPASRTYENCKRWVRQGHKVTVVTCAPNVPDGVVYEGYKNKLYQKENIDGIPVTKVPQVGRFASASLNMTFSVWIQKLGNDSDILHFHFPNPTAEPIAAIKNPIFDLH